jgi:hypothetical protein
MILMHLNLLMIMLILLLVILLLHFENNIIEEMSVFAMANVT